MSIINYAVLDIANIFLKIKDDVMKLNMFYNADKFKVVLGGSSDLNILENPKLLLNPFDIDLGTSMFGGAVSGDLSVFDKDIPIDELIKQSYDIKLKDNELIKPIQIKKQPKQQPIKQNIVKQPVPVKSNAPIKKIIPPVKDKVNTKVIKKVDKAIKQVEKQNPNVDIKVNVKKPVKKEIEIKKDKKDLKPAIKGNIKDKPIVKGKDKGKVKGKGKPVLTKEEKRAILKKEEPLKEEINGERFTFRYLYDEEKPLKLRGISKMTVIDRLYLATCFGFISTNVGIYNSTFETSKQYIVKYSNIQGDIKNSVLHKYLKRKPKYIIYNKFNKSPFGNSLSLVSELLPEVITIFNNFKYNV